MRKLFWQMSVTLDGYSEGPSGELEYTAQVSDADFERYATAMLQSIDAIVLGRATYQLFASYWPTASGPDADRLNELPKIVFSRTLRKLEWSNSRIAHGSVSDEVGRLKQQPGRDIALFGSASLASQLLPLGLIDEHRVFVTPYVLTQGRRMFKGVTAKVPLTLARSETWSSGTVALFYNPRMKGEFA